MIRGVVPAHTTPHYITNQTTSQNAGALPRSLTVTSVTGNLTSANALAGLNHKLRDPGAEDL